MLDDERLLLVLEPMLSSDSKSTLLTHLRIGFSEAELGGDVGDEVPDDVAEPSFDRNFCCCLTLLVGGIRLVSLLAVEYAVKSDLRQYKLSGKTGIDVQQIQWWDSGCSHQNRLSEF